MSHWSIRFRFLLITIGIVILFAAGCSGLKLEQTLKVDGSDWLMLARTEARVNATPEIVVPPLSVDWQYDVTGGIGGGSPLIVDSVLLIGNLRGELHAVNSITGHRLGWVDLGEAIEGSPILDHGVAVVAISNSRESLLALDLSTGKVLWKQEYGDIVTSPLFFRKKIYVGNVEGKFFCIDRDDGSTVWTFALPENAKRKGIRSSPAGEGNSVVFGAEDGTVYALDAGTGKKQWMFQTGTAIAASPAVADTTVYIGGLDGMFYAVELKSGKLRWKFSTETSVYASPAIADNLVIIGTTGGALFALKRDNGSLAWKDTFESVINAGAVVAANIAYVGTLNKQLYALRLSDGSILWTKEMDGRIKTPPAICHGRLYIATDDRLITCFRGSGL
jgi:outer membrane protein assembly factor BamB